MDAFELRREEILFVALAGGTLRALNCLATRHLGLIVSNSHQKKWGKFLMVMARLCLSWPNTWYKSWLFTCLRDLLSCGETLIS